MEVSGWLHTLAALPPLPGKEPPVLIPQQNKWATVAKRENPTPAGNQTLAIQSIA